MAKKTKIRSVPTKAQAKRRMARHEGREGMRKERAEERAVKGKKY